jgi:alpha-glucuronidase
MTTRLARLFAVAILCCPVVARAETGHDLWLRYVAVDDVAQRDAYRRQATGILVPGQSETARVTAEELGRGLRGLLGVEVPQVSAVSAAGVVVAGTPASLAGVRGLALEQVRLPASDGYAIRSMKVGGQAVTVIVSRTDAGVLYGAFHFLRLVQTRRPLVSLGVLETPRIERRILDHWDNLDGTIERGYAGHSLWKWDELPARLDPRLQEYARANASLGINGSVLNNVNANPRSLSALYLEKTAAVAGVFRPYGIRVYLSANFAAPRTLGGLSTADPLDPDVQKWWRAKADEIYKLIPDFGGFLVKANSEGQPGPQDYGRTHADGANVLADAVGPHGGIVLYRAFVYDAKVDPDRVKRAYLEFVPLDGKFRQNVVVQVKNGPLDFQPREPFSPLFGNMPKTPLVAEVQITQEYLGQSTHLVYLAPMWKEFLDADTFVAGPGSPVSKVLDGSLHKLDRARTAIAGVANTGLDENWTGHDFGQANWYAFGRLAWNPDLGAAEIADEWIRMTWGNAADVVGPIRSLMLESREIFVDYTMPLGLHHLIGGDHYAPMPQNDDPRRLDWSAVYYHRADAKGIGFDRTRAGSGAVDQYRQPLASRWNDTATCPEAFLLWFHHLPWDYKLKSGVTLWDGLVQHYRQGATGARGMLEQWRRLAGKVDAARHRAVLAKLERQATEAAAWRDHILGYFQTFSQRPLAER